ncbi:MAG: hypothetical protein AMXMBFR13_14180 [Phycisphaerae bacterium]
MNPQHSSHGHCSGRRHSHPPVPARRPDAGVVAKLSWAWRWFWFILVRNRFSIAVASLIWLVWRSGTQPRRLSYPCQQAAAANLGFLAVLFIPEIARRRHGRTGSVAPHAIRLATGSVALAGVLFVLISAGVSVYSDFGGMSTEAVLPSGPNAGVAPTVVSIVKEKDGLVTAADIDQMVRRAVSLAGGIQSVVQPGQSVVIKPNLVTNIPWSTYPENGITTDARVVASVVALCKEAGAGSVTIAEGSASGWPWPNGDLSRNITWSAYQACGYDTNGDRWFDYDPTVALFDLNDSGGLNVKDPAKVTEVTLGDPCLRRKYWVPNILLNCDVLISVPALKNHGNGSVTISLKNRIGCAPSDIYHDNTAGHPNQMKRALHFTSLPDSAFPRDPSIISPPAPANENTTVNYTIVDLNMVRPQDFVVVDGLVGIQNGPTGTKKADPTMKLVMAGRDSVAIDTVGTLVMGYNPVKVPHIAWADNRGLGTLDTAVVTVVGDHVMDVRQNFDLGWNAPNITERADEIPPTLGDINVPEGSTLTGMVSVTGTGISDDRGVVKSEFSVRPLLGDNLLSNGDFEFGQAGWTTWRTGWGTNEAWDFANTEPGHSGSYCLKLGKTNPTSSFGVYQQVPVTPGKSYRVNAKWKGKKHGAYVWYEILLLDGPWSQAQADDGDDATVVRPNYMYAFDSNTYGLPGDFDWTWTHRQNTTPVDWNNRNGIRRASGSYMTVVLKAGACCGSMGDELWFDDVTLYEVGEEYVVAANPNDPFDLLVDTVMAPGGPCEAKMTVYDAALNEASIAVNAVVVPIPTEPMLCVEPTNLPHTLHVGEQVPDDIITVSNCGIGVLNYSITPSAPWLSANPSSGQLSEGQAQQVAVSYDSVSLPAGLHVATLTVSAPEAYGPPKIVTVSMQVETVKPDFDLDGDVDMSDFGKFQICRSSAPGTAYPAGCAACDLDGDNDVDMTDFGHFQLCLSGEHILANKTCDDALP